MKQLITVSALSLPLLLSACGGGSSTGDSSSTTGTLNLSLTDAPIDEASAVWVEFTGVSIKKHIEDTQTETTTNETTAEEDATDSAEWINIPFDSPVAINLLDLQGSQKYALLTGETLESGTYSEVRLHVNAKKDGIKDSYIVLTDNTEHELDIPSGSQTGLKVKGDITVPENGEAAFTIDFDVRKSIVVQGNGEYKLKPVLHLTQDALTGHISGTVAAELVTSHASNWSCSDEDPDTFNAVYLFNGADATPADISGAETDPLTTALVGYNSDSSAYEFEAGYLTEGDYTVAFTCHADLENTETVENLNFIGTQNVTVTAGTTTSVTLSAPVTETPPEETAPEQPAEPAP